MRERGTRESAIFRLAADNVRTFAEDFARRMARPEEVLTRRRFEHLFSPREDGSTRMREAEFNTDHISGYIAKGIDIDASLRRKLVLGRQLLLQYGPAWHTRFVNLYLTTLESAVVMYWPGKPWGLAVSAWEANAKLALSAPPGDPVLVLDESRPPPRGTHWSELYYDYGVNSWMVSVTEPIYLGDRYLGSVGHDVLLQSLIDRTIHNRLAGTYNMILREDGRLITHPRYMDAIQAQSGALTVAQTGDPNLSRIYRSIRERAGNQVILTNEPDAEYLAVTRLEGPGWYLVTVFPRAIVTSRALQTARLILLLGALALVLEIAILYVVLKRQVAEPLGQLAAAAKRVGAGRLDLALEEHSRDEIGLLTRSFNTMSRELRTRQEALNEHAAHLSDLNERLQQQLSERERMEREVAQQREQLYQSEKLNALGSLLAGVAHELNNPLSVVVGRAIMLEETVADERHRGALGKLRAAAERCTRIVRTFLAMARQQQPQRVGVDIGTIIDSALEVVGYGLRSDGIELIRDIAPDLPELQADPNQLTQVLTNLLLNAHHALLEQAGRRQIELHASAHGFPERLCLKIRDSGPGIPAALRSRIFEPFFTTKPVGTGTGLGLPVSRGMIEAHGGSINVESPAEGGTQFTIWLPAGPPADPRAGAVVAAPRDTAGARILVVDDEPEVAQMLAEIVAGAGHIADIASNGREALERITQHRYQVVLCDLRMPEMDGTELFERICQAHSALGARVIFVTGDTLSENARRFLEQARRPTIEKPLVPDEVRKVVAELLAGDRA